jgi:hypothetical protein
LDIKITDIEHARKLEASISNIGDTTNGVILRSTLIRYYSKNEYVEDLIRLIGDHTLLIANDFPPILSALINSNRIKESEVIVASISAVVKERWDIRVQLARLEINAGRFLSSLTISKDLLLEKQDNPIASGLLIISLTGLNRYSDLFDYIETASEQALSADWAVLRFADRYKLTSAFDKPRMLSAIEKISLSRTSHYRLWSVRLKRMAGFVDEALQELRDLGPVKLLELDYETELKQILSLLPAHPGGEKAERLKRLLPLKKVVQLLKKNEEPPESMTVNQLVEIFGKYILNSRDCIVISISQDNYKKNTGGIQLCIQIEEELAIQRGWFYLNVHPWQHLPILASEKDDPDPLVSLILNGQFLGVCYSSVLTRSIKKINTAIGLSVYTVVHSLLGHSVKHVKDWVKLNKSQKFWIWLHDFFTLCPSYTLQRNDISFCNAPAINSNSCNICNYGEERSSHLELMRDLFMNMSPVVISPSEFTKKLWMTKTENLNYDIKVLPHMELNWFSRKNVNIHSSEQPISIGYLGTKAYFKGWHTFEKLVNRFKNNPKFKFYYLGVNNSVTQSVNNLNIHVTSSDPFSMVNAISEMKIDFVLHWASWPETFSFTTHESIAGGAHVLTNAISGNVAALVSKTGMGTILSDEEELWTFFSQGKAEEIAITHRSLNTARSCKLSFSEMTIPLLTQEHTL